MHVEYFYLPHSTQILEGLQILNIYGTKKWPMIRNGFKKLRSFNVNVECMIRDNQWTTKEHTT